MARKRYSDEDVLGLLREIELNLASGHDVTSACRAAGISDATYYNWRKTFGGIGPPSPTSRPPTLFDLLGSRDLIWAITWLTFFGVIM